MALKTDDCDIRDSRMFVQLGGNGDYYINLIEFPLEGSISKGQETKWVSTRISTSGGRAPTEVKIAVAELFRAMEKHGLNNHPSDDK